MNNRFLVAAALCAATVQPLFPAGLRLAFMDSQATARGNAFAATADSPAAVFYNPGGLTQIAGTDASFGSYNIQLSSRHFAPDGQVTDMRDRFEPVPHLFLARNNPETPWAFGIGAYLPFGLVTDWPQEAPFATMATRSQLTYLRINPVVSFRITPELSIGGGPHLNYSRLNLRRSIGIQPGDEFRVDMDDTSPGYNVGAHWAPGEKHAFGLTYHSRTRLDYTGTAEARPFMPKEEASMAMPFPEIAAAGYSYRPSAAWNFELNVDWTHWDRLNAVKLRRTSDTDELPFHWNSTFMYGFGATRYLPGGHHLSAGYLYAENAVPSTTFTPAVPDSRFHFYSLGAGRESERFSWQAAYHYAYGPAREVPGPSLAAGRYEAQIHALALTVVTHF